MSPLFVSTWTPCRIRRVHSFLYTNVCGFQRRDAGVQLVDSGDASSDRSGAGTVPPVPDSCEEGDSACRAVVVVDEGQSLVSARCLLVVVPPHTPRNPPVMIHEILPKTYRLAILKCEPALLQHEFLVSSRPRYLSPLL
jgi:hypothetical protein